MKKGEKKMKKNIEWLKKEIDTEMIELEPNRAERWSDVKYQTLRDVAQKIYQLDEPEALSEEWIDEHATAVTYDEILGQTEIVYVDDLENLIIPKEESEVTLNRAFEKVSETYPMTKEEVYRHLEKFVAHGGRVTYGEPEVLSKEWIDNNVVHIRGLGDIFEAETVENLLVPKQELPVIPKYVAEFIEEVKASGDRLDDAFSILRGIYHQSKTADWVAKEKHNSETFARAWLDGYEVEDEPLYHALIKGHELVNDYDIYWNCDKFDDDVFVSRLHPPHDNFSTELSKSEWNELGINDSNADFVKVEG